MSLYYSDDYVTLYHGDSLEILPTLDMQAAALLTDPPYFKVKKDAWDNQWGGADQFLGWMGSWLDAAKPLLAANASAWVFASPAMTTAVERVVGERFRVLNSVRWVKRAGWHNRAALEDARSFLTPWEGVIFAEQFEDEYRTLDYSKHKAIFGVVGAHLRAARQAAGLSRAQVATELLGQYRNFDTATSMMSDWEIGKSYISEAAHDVMLSMYGDSTLRGYESIRAEYEQLRLGFDAQRREYEDLRRPFTITDRALSTDVWDFPTVKPYKGKHPCEKPAEMLRHMIEASTRKGDLILDPFAGSGSTLEAARSLRRRVVGIEQDEHWCEQIARKLSAEALDMEEAA